MKALILALGISLMAQEKVPYPFPNYDSDLLAKEIVNGTYMASINMMIKNSRTGDERYVNVPDSPKLLDDMEHGIPTSASSVQSISDTPIYDRDKILEDAVLPKYVDTDPKEAEIISKAMCVEKILLDGIATFPYVKIGRYSKDGNAFFVGVEKTNDGIDRFNYAGDVYTFFRHNGLSRVPMFTFEYDVENGVPEWLYSVNNRNFFFAGDKLYSYNESGYTQILEPSIVGAEPLIVVDGNSFYLVSAHIKMKAQNIDTQAVLTLDTVQSASSLQHFYVSAYKSNYFGADSAWFYIKNGQIFDIEKSKVFHRATYKVRFDYHSGSYPAQYNLRSGVPDYPRARTPNTTAEYIGLKEGIIIAGTDGKVYYTTNFAEYVDSGITATQGQKIVITREFIYLSRASTLIVIKPIMWGYEPPDGRYVERFLKEKLDNRFHAQPYIGE